MFDAPFDFFALAIAIVALIVARKSMNQAAALSARLDAIEATAAVARPVPPPLPPREELAPGPAVAPPPIAEPVAPLAPEQQTEPSPTTGPTAAPPPPLPPVAPVRSGWVPAGWYGSAA
jgi:hypothetical protein